jgi:peptidoglycan-associated lipoprotein
MSRLLLALLMVFSLVMTFGCAMKAAKNSTPAPALQPGTATTTTTTATPGEPLRNNQEQIREETIGTAPPTTTAIPMTVTTEPLKPLDKPAPAGLQVVPFAYDQHLLSDEARNIIAANAAILKATGKVTFQLAGHCDERGSDQYNIALGERRAEAVRAYLLELGIDAKRMETVSYGEERPVNPGRTEECWLQNRRVEFILLP